MDPATYNEVRTRPSLEERLESIISGAALMADSSCTRDDRRERIVQECNSVRQALQDLLTEYMSNVSLIYTTLALSLFIMFIFIRSHTVRLVYDSLSHMRKFFHFVGFISCNGIMEQYLLTC